MLLLLSWGFGGCSGGFTTATVHGQGDGSYAFGGGVHVVVALGTFIIDRIPLPKSVTAAPIDHAICAVFVTTDVADEVDANAAGTGVVEISI